MTFEERIERLTERHEALAQAVELTQHQLNENAAHLGRLMTLIGDLAALTHSHEQRIAGLEEK